MNLTTRLHLVLRLRISGAIPLLPPICLHGLDRDNFTLTLQLDKIYSFKISRNILSILKPLEPEVYVFSKASRLALGPTQPLVKCVPGVVSPVVKRLKREASCPGKEHVDLYHLLPICPHCAHRDSFTLEHYY